MTKKRKCRGNKGVEYQNEINVPHNYPINGARID